MKQMNKDLLDEITDIEVLKDGYRSLNKLIMIKESKLDQQQQEIERLNNNWNELRKWVVNNKHNENTKERYLVVDYGTLLGKMGELKGSEKSERTNFR